MLMQTCCNKGASSALINIENNNGDKMQGNRIYTQVTRVEQQWVEKFRLIPVANISDVMHRMTAGGASLRPMHRSGVLAGPAFTVKIRPGDNLLVHKALVMAQPGDVVVVDAGGDLTNAIVGEIMTSIAKVRGLAGMVINGAIRDLGAIRQDDFPVYAAGVTHRGPYKTGPGEINVPISLNGMVIHPGDLMLGDDDGLLCIERNNVEKTYVAASEKHRQEEVVLANIRQGLIDTAWLDDAMRQAGYQDID